MLAVVYLQIKLLLMIDEERVKKAFREKSWEEIKVNDSWQIFKIMAEFVEGFEKLAKIGQNYFSFEIKERAL